MRKIHHVWVTVYSKPEDNDLSVIEGLRKLFPFNFEQEKINMEKQVAEGFEDRKISILRVHLEKIAQINKFIEYLNDKLDDGQKRLMIKQLESRLDSENHFFLRFDKTKLIAENAFYLTDTGNCYHIKMAIAAFPTTRQNALIVAKSLFE